MATYYGTLRKAWEVIGYIFNGAVMCHDCTIEKRLDQKELGVIFASDLSEDSYTCENCWETLG